MKYLYKTFLSESTLEYNKEKLKETAEDLRVKKNLIKILNKLKLPLREKYEVKEYNRLTVKYETLLLKQTFFNSMGSKSPHRTFAKHNIRLIIDKKDFFLFLNFLFSKNFPPLEKPAEYIEIESEIYNKFLDWCAGEGFSQESFIELCLKARSFEENKSISLKKENGDYGVYKAENKIFSLTRFEARQLAMKLARYVL